MKFSIKDFSSKRDHLFIFTEEILNGKLHFLCSDRVSLKWIMDDCLWKQALKLPQTPLNLISLTILVTLRPYKQF